MSEEVTLVTWGGVLFMNRVQQGRGTQSSLHCRLRLGLEEEVPAMPPPDEVHHIDVRPRWPLTNR